jgi:hypothetical protein
MGLLRFISELWADQPPAPKVVLVQQRGAIPPALRPARPRIVVEREPRSYWEERGWRRNGRTYKGMFQTAFGNWQGCVTESPSGRVEVFIFNPPAALRNHPHWQCFNQRSDGSYFVHPTTPIPDVSAGIISVEKTINEAYAT